MTLSENLASLIENAEWIRGEVEKLERENAALRKQLFSGPEAEAMAAKAREQFDRGEYLTTKEWTEELRADESNPWGEPVEWSELKEGEWYLAIDTTHKDYALFPKVEDDPGFEKGSKVFYRVTIPTLPAKEN